LQSTYPSSPNGEFRSAERRANLQVSRTAIGSSGQQNDETASGSWGVAMSQCDGNLEFHSLVSINWLIRDLFLWASHGRVEFL
jgi:hypothetical protein